MSPSAKAPAEPEAETEPRAAAGPPEAPSPGRSDLEDLVRQHRELDERLQEMAARPRLSPAEEREEAVMKKRKLALKDRIAALSASA